MKRVFILLFFFLLGVCIYAQDIFGSWAYLGYGIDKDTNLLDFVTITKIDDDRAIVQHSFYIKKEYDYVIEAKIVDGTICYHDPITDFDVVFELTSNGNILTWHIDGDRRAGKQYRRPDLKFYDFLSNINDFIGSSNYIEK